MLATHGLGRRGSKDKVEGMIPWYKFNSDYMSSTLKVSDCMEGAVGNMDKAVDIPRYMIDDQITVHSSVHMQHASQMFHSNSLRHLPIVSPENNEIEGILTRKEISHFLEEENLIYS